ncbi:MAG: hypothetical protein ACRD5F_07645 [Candidatus Acidiferrales bacterium]
MYRSVWIVPSHERGEETNICANVEHGSIAGESADAVFILVEQAGEVCDIAEIVAQVDEAEARSHLKDMVWVMAGEAGASAEVFGLAPE